MGFSKLFSAFEIRKIVGFVVINIRIDEKWRLRFSQLETTQLLSSSFKISMMLLVILRISKVLSLVFQFTKNVGFVFSDSKIINKYRIRFLKLVKLRLRISKIVKKLKNEQQFSKLYRISNSLLILKLIGNVASGLKIRKKCRFYILPNF